MRNEKDLQGSGDVYELWVDEFVLCDAWWVYIRAEKGNIKRDRNLTKILVAS